MGHGGNWEHQSVLHASGRIHNACEARRAAGHGVARVAGRQARGAAGHRGAAVAGRAVGGSSGDAVACRGDVLRALVALGADGMGALGAGLALCSVDADRVGPVLALVASAPGVI